MYVSADRQTDKYNRIESPEIVLNIHGHLVCYKDVNKTQWEKIFSKTIDYV